MNFFFVELKKKAEMGCSASLIHESHELDCIDKHDVDLRQTLRLLKWNENNWDLVHNILA